MKKNIYLPCESENVIKCNRFIASIAECRQRSEIDTVLIDFVLASIAWFLADQIKGHIVAVYW